MHSFKTENCTYTSRSGTLFNSFVQTVAEGAETINGIPARGLVAWFNPAEGVTTSPRSATDLQVANWADMGGNYNLQVTAYSNGFALTPPRYIPAAGSTYNAKPYLFFDGSPGQSRNLAMPRRVDENWLLQNHGGYTVVYAQNHLAALGQNSSFISSVAGGIYYDNSLFYRIYAPGLTYYGYKSETQPAINTFNVYAHYYNTSNGHWWWSLNGRYKVSYYTDALVQRSITEPCNIYSISPGSFLSVGTTNQPMHQFDIFVYSRLLCEADYKKIYSYLKTRYLV
jgi:hypothetical protein